MKIIIVVVVISSCAEILVTRIMGAFTMHLRTINVIT